MTYPNGEVPFSVLVHIVDNIWLPPGTAARFAWAFDIAFQKYGIRLRFTPDRDGLGGWNGFRPRSAQVLYKKHYGKLAAAVGFSTHGGNVGGREIFAADIDNWAQLGWARFAAVMRLAGLTVDYVTPREEWHVVDLNNPWVVPSFTSSGGGSALNPGSSTTLIAPEEDEMNDRYIHWKRYDGVQMNAIYNTVSGFWTAWESSDGTYNTNVANGHEIKVTIPVSESHARAIERSCADVRRLAAKS